MEIRKYNCVKGYYFAVIQLCCSVKMSVLYLSQVSFEIICGSEEKTLVKSLYYLSTLLYFIPLNYCHLSMHKKIKIRCYKIYKNCFFIKRSVICYVDCP